MKIAVITFSDFNTNYGSMLQAFALKTYLEGLGHQVTFIKYREFNKDLNKGKKLKERVVLFAKKTILSVYALLKRKDIKSTKENFCSFKKEYFQYTPLYTSNEELRDKLEQFDCYICGSDQIWNLSCLGGLRTPYFLEFVPEDKIKIAYAASMGEYHFNNEESNKIRTLLERLDAISLREEDNVDEVQKLTKVDVSSVVDPVFLLNKDEWSRYISKPLVEGEYGVCYFVRRSNFGKKVVGLLRKKFNIPIYNLSDNLNYIKGTSDEFISVGPMEFVNLIKNAKFTVGTSFHLTAFSVIFGTPFLAVGLESNRSRICNLLKLVDMERNYVTEITDFNLVLQSFLRWIKEDGALNKRIEYSKSFLHRNLNKE